MKILLIEDDESIADSLKSFLQSEYFVVDVSEDGEKGLFCALTNEYSLVILDKMLPKKDGLEVCQEIRRNNKTMPILVLSVKSEVPAKIDLLNAGADDYVTKPFSFEELLARVRAILRRPANIQGEVFKVGDLTLDAQKCEVFKGGRRIRLTRKEFSLLAYLMKNQGNVVSKGKILDNVWDMNVDSFSNTVEMHILNIRRKIESSKRDKIIHTVSGVGYKLAIEEA